MALSLTDWAVLAVVREQPTHGFAVARDLGPEGPLGRVWTVPRPLVYRALNNLGGIGYVEPLGTERSAGGPSRSLVQVTPAGRRAVDKWLVTPVEHVRDLRTALLFKIAMLERRGARLERLVEAQRSLLEPIVASLRKQAQTATGFDAVLASWRVESAAGAVRFLEGMLSPSSGT